MHTWAFERLVRPRVKSLARETLTRANSYGRAAHFADASSVEGLSSAYLFARRIVSLLRGDAATTNGASRAPKNTTKVALHPPRPGKTFVASSFLLTTRFFLHHVVRVM